MNSDSHPDLQGLEGLKGDLHPTVEVKLDLFEASPRLIELNAVPIGKVLRICHKQWDGAEEELRFRRIDDVVSSECPQFVLLELKEGQVVELPVTMYGACASPSGNLLEASRPQTVRRQAYFTFAVSFRLRFRRGSDVPQTDCARYGTPEEHLSPEMLKSHLKSGWVCRGEDGELYWNELDRARSYEVVTGEVLDAGVE